MNSALLLNAVGAIVLVGIWITAVVHVYRSLAHDEKRSAAGGRRPRTSPASAPAGQDPSQRSPRRARPVSLPTRLAAAARGNGALRCGPAGAS